MSIVGLVIMIIFTSLAGVSILAGLFGIAKAIWQRNKFVPRRLAFLVLRISLIFAGGLVILLTNGHGGRLPILLVMAFCALGLLDTWPRFKTFIDGPRNGAA